MAIKSKAHTWSAPDPHVRYQRLLTPSDTQAYDFPPDYLRIEANNNAIINFADRSGEEVPYDLDRGIQGIDEFEFWKIMATGTTNIIRIVGFYYHRPPDPLTVPEEQSIHYEEATS